MAGTLGATAHACRTASRAWRGLRLGHLHRCGVGRKLAGGPGARQPTNAGTAGWAEGGSGRGGGGGGREGGRKSHRARREGGEGCGEGGGRGTRGSGTSLGSL